jgi:DNA-binding transcriptional LysR family regulator
MELRAAEYVCAVVDHGSFTKAAAALDIAQPSLSEGIRRLEAELGVRLFDRVGRSVRLSPAGQAFIGPARQLLRDREAALDAVAAVRELQHGTLDVVAIPTLVADPLAALIGRLRSAHPGVVVRIADPEDGAALERMVAGGESELGLTELPPADDAFVAIRLVRQEIVAVCPPGTAVARAGRLAVAQLARMPLITTPPGTSTRDLLDRVLATERVQPAIAVETSQREAIGPLVLEGAGVGFLPRTAATELEHRGAVVARVTPALSRVIGLVHRAQPLSPAARAFVELARQPV